MPLAVVPMKPQAPAKEPPPKMKASKWSVAVKGLKITTLLSPSAIPPDIVPPEPAPAGNPVLELTIEGTSLTVHAQFNGKSVRRGLKTIAEHGPDNVTVMVQGNLVAGSLSGSLALDCAGFTVTPKASAKDASC
jgi:hypothetical protein